jgi:hypothetical protein
MRVGRWVSTCEVGTRTRHGDEGGAGYIRFGSAVPLSPRRPWNASEGWLISDARFLYCGVY